MAEEENQDEGQEVFLDDDQDTSSEERSAKPERVEEDDAPSSKDDNMSDAEVSAAADRVESGEDDLEGDYGAKVRKRIQRLIQQRKEVEAQSQEATSLAQRLLEENRQLKSRVERLDSGYLNEYGSRIEAQIGAARKAYKDAWDAGDTDAMIAAQETLARATNEKDRYELAKRRADQQRALAQHRMQQPQPGQGQPGFQPQMQPQQRQAPQPDPKAQSWAEKNEWFGQDEVMTYAAFGIHRQLVEEEGFDPTSDEYYSEVDRRMRAEFPRKFASQQSSGKKQVASAGSSASRSTKQGRRSVKLSPSQIAIAKKLNVPLEEYAKYVKE